MTLFSAIVQPGGTAGMRYLGYMLWSTASSCFSAVRSSVLR